MALRIRSISPDATPSSQLSLETLARVLRPAIVTEVIDRCAAREKRARKLPASTVLLLCVAMNLYSNDCLTHVFFRLVSRIRWLLSDPDALRVSKGALCQARYRLGARPLVELFRRVCKPLATPSTPQAFLFGLRLMALDATVMRISPPLGRSSLPTTPAGSSSLPSMRSRPTSANPKSLCAPRGRWASFKKPTGFWWPTT